MKKRYKDGEECSHKNCVGHITHPCEGCGRIGAVSMKLIGFSGPAGCGKTTAATALSKLTGGKVLSFATPIKECLTNLFGFTSDQLYTLRGKEAIDHRYGVSPRQAMQRFGTEFVRTTVPDLWCILLREKIKGAMSNIFVDDLRFEDEAALIRSLGGIVVHIRGRKLMRSNHKSEEGLLCYPNEDLIIDSSGSKEEFLSEVMKIL